MDTPLRACCGFLLAERLDFGSPKSINSLYRDLLGVSPFSKAESKVFDEVLSNRNLLVHHGGTYTTRFLRSKPSPLKGRTFLDSVVVARSMVYNAAALTNEVALKTILATKQKLDGELKRSNASTTQWEGFGLLALDSKDGPTRTDELRQIAARCAEQEQQKSNEDIPF